VIFAVVVAGNLVVLALSTLVVLLTGANPADLWSRLDLPFMWLTLGNGLVFMFLWWAPVVGWLMLVSAWARRMTFLWAVGPFLAVMVVERIAIGKPLIFYQFVRQRLAGAFAEAFTVGGQGKTYLRTPADLDLGRMYSNPELWIGVLVAAVFLAIAVRLRRSSHPI
jgi:ABC-2 type transport system permease protein